MLERTTSSTALQTNVLSDEHFTCSYKEILEISQNLQRYLAEREISTTDCIALECANTVPGALILLYLLQNGYSFLLLPEESSPLLATGKKPFIPRFCRYRITLKGISKQEKSIDLGNPDSFLNLTENEEWSSDHSPADPTDPKLYLRTSGSTGTPKLVVHSHAKLLGNALNCVERLGLQSSDRVAIPVPIFHMYGLGAAFLPAVAIGASIDLQKNSNLLKYLHREKTFDPNVAFMTPSLCEMFTSMLRKRGSPRTYKFAVVAGDRIKEDTFVKFESLFGPLVKLYGSTEMGAIAAASPEAPSDVRVATVGQPMPDVEVRALEGNIESINGIERLGELWCNHRYGFEGYVDEYGKSYLPHSSSQPDWFCTKDLGRIGSEGHIEVLGRVDHSVNRDGLLVFFTDIERAIESMRGIERAVVVATGESQRGKGIVAYCVPAETTQLTEADVRTACFDVLPRRAVPERICMIRSLPLLPNGKVDRQKLVGIGDQVNNRKS
jgi:acyl-coenzyme A synthetase/AMP-(fatty) acid ligase